MTKRAVVHPNIPQMTRMMVHKQQPGTGQLKPMAGRQPQDRDTLTPDMSGQKIPKWLSSG